MSVGEVLYGRTNGSSDSDGTTDDWDDSTLIAAYNKAVQNIKTELENEVAGNKSEKPKGIKKKKSTKAEWKVGDRCRSRYTDGIYYEAEIISITPSDQTGVVRYFGFENEETVQLAKLKSSKGETARMQQLEEAVADSVKQEVEPKSNPEPSSHMFHPPPLTHFPFKPSHMSIAPPPLPQLYNSTQDSEAINAMLTSWYLSGYHTGYYQGLQDAKQKHTSRH